MYLFIYFWLHWVSFAACGLSLVALSRDCSPVVRGLPIVVVSLVAEHGLYGTWASVVAARGLRSCCSAALEHRLSSCGTQV